MPRTPENRSAYLAAVLARALPDAHPARVAAAVTAMQIAAAAFKRASENECSFPMTDAQLARANKRCDRLAGAARSALMRATGGSYVADDGAAYYDAATGRTCFISLRFGGDPRSPCGWLQVDGQPGDGWDRDAGYPIYR